MREHPDDEGKRASHEAVYRSLFIQTRGILKKELPAHLRATRSIRGSRQATLKRSGPSYSPILGQIKDTTSVRERPVAVEDHAISGHWEGDLIAGSGNSFIATSVERHSRFVMRKGKPGVPENLPLPGRERILRFGQIEFFLYGGLTFLVP